MVRGHAHRLLGVHFNNVCWAHPKPDDRTPEEERYLGASELEDDPPEVCRAGEGRSVSCLK
jgi:hypothetical protein